MKNPYLFRNIYSCVLAEQPKFAIQVLVWIWTLIEYSGVPPSRIVVHALESSCPHTRRSLERLGITILDIKPFHADHPSCNKLRQLESAVLREAELCVLCDTDIAFVESIETHISYSSVRAKMVDLPNPPMPMWQQIIKESGLPAPRNTVTRFGMEPTPSVNFDGGLYLIPAKHFQTLGEAWPKWARWLIDRPQLMSDKFRKYIDQVSFGLACIELDLPTEPLNMSENYSTHPAIKPKPDISPSVIHYQSHVDPNHFLKTVGAPNVDNQIQKVNRTIRSRIRKEFDNQIFWNFRYSEFPGVGSEINLGEHSLQLKRSCITHVNQELQPMSVLDIGCGDLEVTKQVNFPNYTGMDLSAYALQIANLKKPGWNFVEGDPIETEMETRDLILCLDVLIHQPSRTAYFALLGRLLSLAGKHLVVSGYNQPPRHSSEITFYYEPLSTSLRRIAPNSDIKIIGDYRDITIIQVNFADPTPFQQKLYETHFGQLWSKPGDLITDQLSQYQGHTRNELAMLLSMIGPGDCIVDIGTHIGSFAVPIAKEIGRNGQLICAEPEPVNFCRLSQNLILNMCEWQTELHESAVGPASQYRYVADEHNTGAGFLHADTPGDHLKGISLDEICNRHTPTLIKIDVEGMELEVLLSGEQTIAKNRPLLYIEVSSSQLERAGSSVAALESWLEDHNFHMFRNSGPRNSNSDVFKIQKIDTLALGLSLFDCLAVPSERLNELISQGKIPQIEKRTSKLHTIFEYVLKSVRRLLKM